MMSSNWFANNPKKTIFAFLLVFFIVAAYGTEKILSYKNHGYGFNFNLPNRAIALREYRPTMKEILPAGQQEIHYDTLPAKDYLLRIDNDGFIIPSKQYAHPDLSIVFLGGSTTECRFVEELHRFPYLSGKLLEQKLGLRINSYNAGRSGNDSLHSLDILLNKVIPIQPDIVVMMHNINDLSILLHEKSYWSKNSSRSVIFNVNDEIVANFFKIMRDRYIPNLAAALHNFDKSFRGLRKSKQPPADEFAKTRGQPLVFDPPAMLAQFNMNLQSFIYLCQARHITPVLMTQSSRFKDHPDRIIADAVKDVGLDYHQFKDLFDSFNDAIRRKAHENQVLLIDLAQALPQEKEYLYDIVHHNDQGSIKTAQIISEQLQPLAQQVMRQKRD
jgi:hypothetical protein